MAAKYAKDQPVGFSNRVERVAIVGAGGTIGKYIVQHLLKTGQHTVTAITRPTSTNKMPDGVRAIAVDYSGDDDSALVEALKGQQALIITMSVSALAQTAKLIRAASKAEVPYILPNWWGHDASNDKLLADSMLKDMRDGVYAEIQKQRASAYVLLVCNFWYEFSLAGGPDRFGFDFQRRTLVQFDDGNVPINVSTWPMVGGAVAGLLSLKQLPADAYDTSPTLSQYRNGMVYVSSFRLTQLDMFESVKRVTGTTDADWTITHESAEQRWKDSLAKVKAGDFSAFPKMHYSRMFLPSGDGDYESRRGLDNDALGLAKDDLDTYTAIAARMGENGEVAYGH